MLRAAVVCAIAMAGFASPLLGADPLSGTYVEARTCQVYTGPCFANGEVGSVGKDAVMTWQINRGEFAGVDLSGQAVAMIVKASNTLGFNGFDDAKKREAIVIVDESADSQQAAALQKFAVAQAKFKEADVAAVYRADIEMQFDVSQLTAKVDVGDFARLETRKARPGDCICSNESAYYPPLVELQGFVPGVTIEGEVAARKLGTRWSIPDSRTAYLGTFSIKDAGVQLAGTF